MEQAHPILQERLIDPPWSLPAGDRLPGTSMIEADDWLRVDDVFAQQMKLRDHLLQTRLSDVHQIMPEAFSAACETLDLVLDLLPTIGDYYCADTHVIRPDGVKIQINRDLPLVTIGRLVQEDICIHLHNGDEHVLTAGLMCFPASWSLKEKIGRPLTGVHEPVDEYDDNIAKRVQRMFDALRPEKPIRRANCLAYSNYELFQPRREDDRRVKPTGPPEYVRTERQCLLKLPRTGAVVFTIHTCVVRRQTMPVLDRANLEAFLNSHAP